MNALVNLSAPQLRTLAELAEDPDLRFDLVMHPGQSGPVVAHVGDDLFLVPVEGGAIVEGSSAFEAGLLR